ncbi:Vacuolar fusion protein mon1 [Varicellaria rhodocarpa]|nr:Vacuolar fusion protein mon1 [Varicellaria rhodocarpa]
MSTGSAESQSTEVAGQPSNVLTASEGELSLNTPNDDSTIHSPEYKRPEISSEMASGKLVESSDTSVNVTSRSDEESSRPTLPPRPRKVSLLNEHKTSGSSLQVPKRSMRPQLPSQATTALSLTDIHTQSFPDGSRETYANSTRSTPSGGSFKIESPAGRHRGRYESEGDESASIISYAPTVGTVGDAESLLGDILGVGQQSPAWRLMSSQTEKADPFSFLSFRNEEPTADFNREFDELDGLDAQGDNEEELLNLWKSKRKHFLILSSAGKPIYNRHGDDNLISGYIGVVQTIISFYEGAGDQLKSFTAGGSRFVIMTHGPVHLVAISKLGESDTQLRVQLDALYMQILSTLTLPTLTHLFSNRPSTDLRRPLQGTETLLSALADTFTRGSPPTLLSALECLKLRKSHRQVISTTMLKSKSDSLLYGLIVAGGRLVSVIRPRSHSLHPGDLQLIFNMLFEAGGVKAGGGENWIPLCLPGFNKNGYLYMYVSFLNVHDEQESSEIGRDESRKEDQVAILLISANKESFYDLRTMRDTVVEEMRQNGSMKIIKTAVLRGRPEATDIVPGTVLRHFLYKSRGNLQYVMPSYEPHFTTLLARRKLLSLYHTLHASVHAKMAHLRVHHCISRESVSLAWITPLFELYCVAGPNASRNALAQSANKIVQWIRREEERVFIIGGAVF